MKSLVEAQIASAIRTARSNARQKGILFELDAEALTDLWEKQRGCCALSGLPFHDEAVAGAFVRHPFAASLDRIDPAGGYTVGNVQLVCTAVNFARGQWGDDVLRQIAYGIVETERRQQRDWFARRRLELAIAEAELADLSGAERLRARRHIAGLKAALTKGPSRLRRAGSRAKATRARGTGKP